MKRQVRILSKLIVLIKCSVVMNGLEERRNETNDALSMIYLLM
jgi:hypothetical protein